MSIKAQEPPNKTGFSGISGLFIVPIILVSILGCNNTLVEYEDSTYSKLEDERNEKLAFKNIKSSLPEFRGTNINVNSFKGIVLISGQVVSEDYITLATKAVESMRNVSSYIMIKVAGPTYDLPSNDAYLSSKIRAKLASSKNIEANRVKVVENERHI